MLFQQMKSNNSIKIEAVGVQSTTSQLREEDASLNSSPINTSSIAIGIYNIQHNSIFHK